MAEVVWTDPALADLDAIADYVALDNPRAAAEVVRRVFEHVERLHVYPLLGPVVPELPLGRYRHLVEAPCRVFYRVDGDRVIILHVLRAERLVRPSLFAKPMESGSEPARQPARRRRPKRQ
jgi:toxin ParE1/3/4